jgi:hypothetical protein
MGDRKNTYRVLVGNAAGKGQLSRPMRRWEDILGCMWQKSGSGLINVTG